ncbi:EpsG family protein [Pseudomonas spirodelae]|uniref:EpsG family protein n=1 Tax=Pseudomonas spirodelae TaxID=3101751 RepID=UPI00398C683C
MDFVLMRNFLSFAILLQGMLTLFEAKPYCKMKYALFVLVAATVHQSSLIFIVFMFMPLNRVVSLRGFFLVYMMLVICYVLVRFNVPLPAAVAAHFNYYDTSLKSAFTIVFVHLVSMVLMTFVVLAERKSLCRVECAYGRDKELVFILNLNIFSLFFLVLYFESEIFIRLFRTVLFFNIMHCAGSLFLLRRTYLFLVFIFLFFLGILCSFLFFPSHSSLLFRYSKII